MGLISCPQCNQEFEDDVLCCPHCGAAQIPQMTKAQLRLEQMKAARGPLAAIYLGMTVGLVLGAAVFTVALLQGVAGFEHGLGILMGGMLGSALGFLSHRLFASERDRP
jgi:hypothetical protein